MTPQPGRGVGEVVEGVRRHISRQGTVAAALWVGVVLAGFLVLAWLLVGRGGWRGGSWTPLLLDLGALGALAALLVQARRLRGRVLREDRVTGAMERAAGLPGGTVRGALEISRGVPPGVSRSLAAAAERSVVSRLTGTPGELAGELDTQGSLWIRRGWGCLAVLALLLLAGAFLFPDRSRLAWGGLTDPVGILSVTRLAPLSVSPGTSEILRGAPLDVRVGAPGRDEVTLHWSSPGELPDRRTMAVSGEGAAFRFPSVDAPLEYWAEAPDGARSPRYTVTPVDPLFLSELEVTVEFPPHTGRLPEVYRGEVPPLAVPAGTRLQVEGRGSRVLREATLEGEAGGGAAAFQVDGTRFSGEWIPREDGLYLWRLVDAGGGTPGLEPSPLQVSVIPDAYPEIRITAPGRDTVLAAGFRQPLVIEAADDHGVATIEVVAYRVTGYGERHPPVTQRLETGGSRGVLVRPTLDVSRWGLLPGDTVRYLARAVDNNPRPQVTATAEFVLRVPGTAELRREVQSQLDEVAARVEGLAGEAARVEEETRNLERSRSGAPEPQSSRNRFQPQEGGEMEFGEREEVRRAAEAQEGLVQSVDSLQDHLAELSQSLRDAGLPDPELRKDLSELQQLLGELAPQELRDRLRELGEALERNDSREVGESLESVLGEQEAFRERLEESLDRFRQAAAEQEFRSTTGEAEELARKQDALTEAMRQEDQLSLRAEQQEGLAQEAGELAERMERLQERMERLGDENAAQSAQRAADQARDARERMEEAAQQARDGQPQEAAAAGEEASESLEEVVQELQQARQEMAREQQEAVERALLQTAQDALALAREQAEIRENTRGTTSREQLELRADEQALLQGLQSMAQNLALATRSSPEVDRQISRAIGEAMQAVERTMEALDPGRRGPSPSPLAAADQAVSAMNHVAMLALENARMVAEGGEGGGSAMDALLQELEQLAQEQGDLMSQTGAIMPLQLSGEALQSAMEQLAQGQEAVAGELGELADRPGSTELPLGDVESMAQEARALAQELAQGRLDPETLQRQERLFQRLLDAGRTLEREEFSEEREGTTAGVVERELVAPLTAGSTGLRYELPESSDLQRLPPAQRQLVLQYFERLNRQEAPGRPPAPVGGTP